MGQWRTWLARSVLATATVTAVVLAAGSCGADDRPETADDFARRSCAAFLGTADVPDHETREQDRARHRRETDDAVRAAELNSRWHDLADAQRRLLRVNEREAVPDDERNAAIDQLVAACTTLGR